MRSAALTGAVTADAFKAMFTTFKKESAIQTKGQSPEGAVAAQLKVIDGSTRHTMVCACRTWAGNTVRQFRC